MPKKNKQITLILAGGTVLLDKQGNIFCVQKKEDISLWLEKMPELKILADLKVELIAGEDDILGSEHWEKMAQIIKKQANQSEGFVIVCAVEQLIQTGVALSYLLQNFPKTIILTSANISGTDYNNKKAIIKELREKHGGSGLKSNLINAIQVASQALASPAIMFGTRLMPAVRAIYDPSDLSNQFVSLDNNYWGRVDFGISIKSGLGYAKGREQVYGSLDAKVLLLHDVLGLDWPYGVEQLSKYEAIALHLSGNYELEKKKREILIKSKKPAVIYYPHLSMLSSDLICLGDCSWNSVVIKLMWALANRKSLPALEKVMRQNVVGEFVER